MKKKLTKVLAVTLVLTLILASAVTAVAAEKPGIQVQYNGQNITFTDAVPKIVDGRTMVPFRQILETMGAEVSYDNATKTVMAKTDEMELNFAVGSTDIKVIKNGETTVKKTDVAPFIEKATGRTLVGARFMAEALGNTVAWDAVNKTAVIMDMKDLFANADQDFSILALMMSTDLDMEKAYETTGSFSGDIDVTVPGTTAPVSMSMSGKISGVQQKTDVDMVMTYAMDMSQMMAEMTPEEKAQMAPMMEMFNNISMKIKMEGESGDMYMNSGLFATIDPSFTADTWMKMNLYDTYDAMGIDMRPLMEMASSKMSMSELLPVMFMSMETADIDTYKEIQTAYAFMKNLMGDQAFRSQTSGSITTHTLTLDQTKILAAMAKTALEMGITTEAAEMAEMAETLKDANIKADIVIKESKDALYNYSMKASGGDETISLILDMTGDTYNSDLFMSMEMIGFMKLVMEMDAKVVETTKTPDLTLPTGAKIIDYGQYMTQMMQMGQ
jgi:hypothetical protein